MNRTSSRKDLRAERISNSPYRRERPPVVKQRSWFTTLTTSISASFSSLRARDGAGSVSGSDDEWGGEAPSNMVGQDVFSLAEAAGRNGEEFEARAEAWRANKSTLGKNRLSPSKSAWNLLDLETKRVRPSPSMPALRPLASSSNPTSFRTPTTQLARSNGVPASASAAALQAFVSSKGDGAYSTQDIESMETLLRSVKADSLASQPTGGWSGSLTSTRKLAPSTSGSNFSLGSTPPAAKPLPAHSRVKYLGPGMSPRRFRSTTNMRSMFSLFDEDTSGKKRKTETLPDVEVEVLDDDEPSTSTPNTAASDKATEFNQRARNVSYGATRPSPLGLSVTASSSKTPTSRDIGRKRVNDMIQDVIDNEITPHEEKPQQVFNPYESVALPAGKHYSPYASLRRSSGTNRSMRRSLGSSRGAAAKLDSERGKSSTSGRPLSTLDLINSTRPLTAKKQKAADPPKKQKKAADEPIVIDDDEPAPAAAASEFSFTLSRKTPAAVTIDEPEPVSAFPAPSLSQSRRGPSAPPPKTATPAPVTSTSDSIIAASKPAPAPLFSTQPLGLGPPPSKPIPTPSKPRAPSQLTETGNLYLSAKDTALNVDTNALPFFTFTLSPGSDRPQPNQAAKAIVSAGLPKIDGFTFELPNATLSTAYPSPPSVSAPSIPSTSFSIPKKAQPAGAWTCDVCMLQNTAADTDKCGVCEAPKPGAKPKAAMPTPVAPPPAAASFGFGSGFKPPAKPAGAWMCDVCMLQNTAADTEKCSVCEAPKPGAKAAAAAAAPLVAVPTAPSGGFNFAGAGFKPPAKAAGDWDCGVCSLKNPASAIDKCTICEAPRPGAKAAVPAAPSPMPAAPSDAFSFGKPATVAGEWTCDLCMLKNPATATDKCTVCEAPKPGAVPKPAAMPSAPPAAPTGGFSFGGKSLSSEATSAPPPPPTGGFSFGGKPVSTSSSGSVTTFGGFKAPAPAVGGFSFGGKTVGGDAPAASSFGGFGTPPTGGFSFGQKEEDKPAMLSKPTGAAGEWTCSLCGLLNPASAADKCTICEAPK
ncbi:hypothetical protein CspeluHIS016_0301890 [Cutaneotrichosporon spelunceum]|uniref:RanBP2-type domain-containing protein n=1 Tax=Cutaneotrichosporon spelunceum TaxID=1672016 RepID=A0AAD3YC09_9TREE|nr:hypothetical protein CspeluHIS016_0301890 [Cutaneotrichosporon spelunceum]